ncbi:chromosome partitioning protein ParB, partial [Sinorhizobium medicae]
GKKLITAKRIVEQRRQQGKGLKYDIKRKSRPLSSEAILKAFQEDVDRKRILIRRAETAKARLTFITEAIRSLLADKQFSGMLAEEGLISLPAALVSRLEN